MSATLGLTEIRNVAKTRLLEDGIWGRVEGILVPLSEPPNLAERDVAILSNDIPTFRLGGGRGVGGFEGDVSGHEGKISGSPR